MLISSLSMAALHYHTIILVQRSTVSIPWVFHVGDACISSLKLAGVPELH